MGRKAKYTIKLTEEEQQALEGIIRAHSTPQSLAKRAKIILMMNEEESVNAISDALDISRDKITKWTKRWCERSGDVGERLADEC